MRLFWKPADGSREAVPLTTDDAPNPLWADSFSPDGSVLAFFSNSPETGYDLWLLRLEGIDPYEAKPPEPEVFLKTPFGEAFARFSPDGRWIAYQSDESGRYEIYVTAYPGPGGRIQISRNGGEYPLWSPNGREIYYSSMDGRYYAVEVTFTPEIQAGEPQLLFEGPFIGVAGHAWNITPDGQHFILLENKENFEPRTTLTVITNFFDELRRHVPPNR
jgi:hypothetical protein